MTETPARLDQSGVSAGARVFDRDKAREALREYARDAIDNYELPLSHDAPDIDAALDVLETCVADTLHTIDRDALIAIAREMRIYYLGFDDSTDEVGPDEVDDGWTNRILALVRPVDGITLTPEEAARALRWYEQSDADVAGADQALAARLEAAS